MVFDARHPLFRTYRVARRIAIGLVGGTVLAMGVVMMVGGNIPGVTRTLSVAIYEDVQALDYVSAGRTSLVLVLFAFAALSVLHLLQRKGRPA